MINLDPSLDEIRSRAIARLIERRRALEASADSLAAEPAAYGITGSVNVTNRDVDKIRAEIAEINLEIKQLLIGGGSGFSTSYPNYRIGRYSI